MTGLFDALLALGLLWLGWQIVISRTLFRAIILFIVFGLFIALCWARLAAPDVALAEAAIGAGLTGALLLNAYRALPLNHITSRSGSTVHSFPLAILVVLVTALVGSLSWVLLNLPKPAIDLTLQIQERLPESGVLNPVTAVLLNFRGYDTLLEVAVLLLAFLGIRSVWNPSLNMDNAASVSDSLLVNVLVQILTPLAIVIAVYMLWAGAHAPGGAFQAGTVLAAVGVLWQFGGQIRPEQVTLPLQKIILVMGISIFTSLALGMMVLQGHFLEYPKQWTSLLILVIESALTLSIALTLTLLFANAPGIRKTSSWSKH